MYSTDSVSMNKGKGSLHASSSAVIGYYRNLLFAQIKGPLPLYKLSGISWDDHLWMNLERSVFQAYEYENIEQEIWKVTIFSVFLTKI